MLPLPGQEVNKGPLYRLPWSVVFNMALAASALGSARGFVDAWMAATRDRKLNSGGRAADDALIQHRLAEAVWYLDASVAACAPTRSSCGKWPRRASPHRCNSARKCAGT